MGASGPWSPSYQRWAVSIRPSCDITRGRPRPSSQETSSTAGSSLSTYPGASRSSSGAVGIRSPTPRSPGWSRSFHGSQPGASSASGPGSSTVSQMVTCRLRGTRVTVTAHRQPLYPARWDSKKWVTTRSPSATASRWSPMSLGSTSVMAPRATPTASAQTWSRRAARAVVLVVPYLLPPTAAARWQRPPQITARGTGRGSTGSVRMVAMPLLPTIGRTVGTGIKAARLLVRGSLRGGAWATRRVGSARARGAANEVGMIRLFDLHAISCAGDTLIAIGLAGTIFFNVPLGEARSKVALYLLITMVPFALLAPVVGPVLDHFRHGRRYALAVTMLGRAFLAYVISDHLFGWGLYPAAFGVLALSRAYGVARSAAVPRLLPEGIGLSQVGARASVYGTFAGAVVAPIGLAAFWFGPQWPLRVASLIFLVGVVISLRLPPRADSDPPEAVPRPFRTMLRLRRGDDRPLSGRLVVAA